MATKDDAEIDLVVERPGKKILFIEIKSSTHVESEDLRNIRKLSNDFGDCEAVFFSRDKYTKRYDGVTVYPWAEGIKKFFTTNTPP